MQAVLARGFRVGEWLSPDDHWPEHSRPEAQRALADARAAGWWLKKSNAQAKVWGVITCGCPDVVPKPERCATSVMSTSGPSDGSRTATALRGEMRRCSHVRAEPRVEAVDRARGLIESANQCLEVADRLIAAGSHRDFVDDYLAQALEEAEEADLLLLKAEEAERQQVQALGEAVRHAEGLPLARPLDAPKAIDQALDLTDRALKVLGDDARHEARLLRGRADEIKTRANMLRRLL